ncbi:MAG TPA: hypothetical protein VGS11_03475 [Candidatus Bathyarchaeia archaeon]|nr:hypothetical protein [Candidatus Bathyarchaeia archaeon]
MRLGRAVPTIFMLSILAVSIGLALQPAAATGSGITIDNFLVQPITGVSGGQRLINVTVGITNSGTVAQNFTIKLVWDDTTVTSQKVTNFAPGARRLFTLAQSVAFDPTTGHYVGVSAGDAWVAIPVYRPPGYGTGSSNLPRWNDEASLAVGLAVAISISITLILLKISRRVKATPSVTPAPPQCCLL